MIKPNLLAEELNTHYLKFLGKKDLPPLSALSICSFTFIGKDACVFLLYLVVWLNTILHFLAQFLQIYLLEALLVCLSLIDLITIGIKFLQFILMNFQP